MIILAVICAAAGGLTLGRYLWAPDMQYPDIAYPVGYFMFALMFLVKV